MIYIKSSNVILEVLQNQLSFSRLVWVMVFLFACFFRFETTEMHFIRDENMKMKERKQMLQTLWVYSKFSAWKIYQNNYN